jgi:hypothetical protein
MLAILTQSIILIAFELSALYKVAMKNIKLFSVMGLLLVGSTAFASDDQYLEVEAFSVIDNGQISKFKAMCNQIGKEAQGRMDAYLAANADLDAKDVNVSAKYEIDFIPRGGISGNIGMDQRMQICNLRIRLNDATRKLSLGKSEVYFTGRGKAQPCRELKKEIDQSINVIYSEVNNNLFRCNIKPIISINKI